MKIDVVVLTMNSAKFLEPCLASIYSENFVCHLIIVDGFSSDGTMDIVRQYGETYKNVKVIQSRVKHGKAREIGIKSVDTEWFAFIDSDAVLRPGWFKMMVEHVATGVLQLGSIESNLVHHYPEGTPKFPEFEHVIGGKRIDPRALTIATLIKREAVSDLLVPEELPIFEDEFIKNWIEKKGYVWAKVVDAMVDHFPRPKPFKDAYLMGVYSARYHVLPRRRIILVPFLSPFKLLLFWYKTRSLTTSFNSVKLNFFMLKGLLDEILGIASDKKTW